MNNSKIKIEHGIPIPSRRYGKCVSVMSKLKPGDSIVVPAVERVTWATTGYRLKFGMASRKVAGNMVRIWRIK